MLPEPDQHHTTVTRILLVSLLLIAAGVRVMAATNGLPYLHEWDEPATASRALRMLQTADLNPHFFHYGTFLTYLCLGVDLLWAGFMKASGQNAEIRTFFDTGWFWAISHPSIYFWNRVLVAGMGVASVLIVCDLTVRLTRGSWGAGLLGGSILAGLQFHITQSASILPNVPVAFLVLLAVALSVRYQVSGRPVHFLGALVACGLAISTKYNAALCLVVPALALATGPAAPEGPSLVTRRWLWSLLLPLPFLMFLAGTPYALLDLPGFLGGVGYQVREYYVQGHGVATVDPGLAHLWRQASTLTGTLGPFWTVLALIGLCRLLTTRSGRVIAVFPIIYAVYMSGTRVTWHRNFIPVYPFIAIAGGCGAWLLIRFVSGSLRGGRTAVRGTAAAVILLVLVWLGMAMGTGWATVTSSEARTTVIDELNELGKRTELRVGIESELRIHEQDLAHLSMWYEEKPLIELLCDASSRKTRVNRFVTATTHAVHDEDYDADATIRNMLLSVVAGMEPAPAVHPLFLDKLSIDPDIRVISPGGIIGDLECHDPIKAGALRRRSGRPALKGELMELPLGSSIVTPTIRFVEGESVVAIRARGHLSGRGRLKVGVTLEDDSPDGPPGKWPTVMRLGSEMIDHYVLVTLDKPRWARLRIEGIRAVDSRRLGRDRVVFIESVRVATPASRKTVAQ